MRNRGRKMLVLLTVLLAMLLCAFAAQADQVDEGYVSMDAYVTENPELYPERQMAVWSRMRSMPLEVSIEESTQIYSSINRYSVLALDTSGSMRGTPIAKTREAAISFCRQVLEAEGNNYVAVITLNTNSKVVCSFTNDLTKLTNAINGLIASGSTNHHDALRLADELLSDITTPGAIKNILLMSDGLPESGPTKTSGRYTSSEYSYGYHYANAAYEKASTLWDKYSIYSLGFFHSLSGKNLAFGQRFMSDLQNMGYYEVNNPSDLEFEFGQIAEDLLMGKGMFSFAGSFNEKVDTNAQYYYRDDYFTRDSTIYNPSLATMSLCLELSTWSSYEESVWSNKTKNVKNLLNEIGFDDYEQNSFWNSSPTLKSIGAVAANKKIGDATLIALVVRGGAYYNEWGSNFLVGSSGNHTGFAEGRDNVVRFLKSYISKNQISGRVKLWVVGYSRGGAVANMVAGYLNQNPLTSVSLAKNDLYCYTFEAPQGTTKSLSGSNASNNNIHNIVNANDLVPLVAPSDWNFRRHNTKSRPIPTITTNNFSKAKKAMLAQYNDILTGVNIQKDKEKSKKYNIPEYAQQLDYEINWTKFLPGGDPFIEIFNVDDKQLTQATLLTNTVSSLASNITRKNFSSKIEKDLAQLLNDVLGVGNEESLEQIMINIGEELVKNDYKKLKYVLAPAVEISFASTEERITKVAFRLQEVILQANGYTDPYGAVAELAKTLAKMIVNDADVLLDVVLTFATTSPMQAHYPEITLAWVRSQDPYYTGTPFDQAVPETMRVIRINCPVDVIVYDGDNQKIASIIGTHTTSENEVVGCAINKDGEKIIHLPSDEEYRILIKATGDGTVNYAVNEYNVVYGTFTRLLNYFNVEVKKGDELTGLIPALDESDYTDEDMAGSEAEYPLLGGDGHEVKKPVILTGENIPTHKITAKSENEFGGVLGGGEYLFGSFAQVQAAPIKGGSFLGWYVDGKLVSTDSTYRFAVDGDCTIVARFSKVDLYGLKFEATLGGTVENVDGHYSEGTVILLSAKPDENAVFDHWEITGGKVEEEKNPETSFTMPAGDVKITAVFVPGDMPELPDTGDDSHLILYTLMLCISCAAVMFVLNRKGEKVN
ncbi:MAG: VWA domain-containing protein [Clostridia bacterium]|nr:VWA domain-containing protein [Clostridia bacterium]